MKDQKGYCRGDTGRARFVVTWLIVILITAAVWVLVLALVSACLAEYESVQPRVLADAVFDEYFADCDCAALIRYSKSEISQFESDEDALRYLTSLYGSEGWTYSATTADVATDKKYSVRSGDNHVGTFTLVPDDKESPILHMTGYRLADVELFAVPRCGVNIYAPAEATVMLNGVPVGREYITGDPVVLEAAVYFPEDDDDARVMVNYYIDGLYFDPRVEVTKSADRHAAYLLEYDAATVSYSAEYYYLKDMVDKYNSDAEFNDYVKQINAEKLQLAEEERLRLEAEERARVSEEIKGLHGQFVTTAVQTYLRYIHRAAGTTKAKTLSYFEKGTDIYNYINTHPNFELDHDSYRFDGTETSDFVWLNDQKTEFSCRIKTEMVISGTIVVDGVKKKSTWSDYFEQTIYVRITGNTLKIYAMALIGVEDGQ